MDYEKALRENRHKKIFSIQDLINMGFITEKQLQDAIDYTKTKDFVLENFRI